MKIKGDTIKERRHISWNVIFPPSKIIDLSVIWMSHVLKSIVEGCEGSITMTTFAML